MAQTPEGKVKADVVTILKKEGVWYFIPVSNGMGQSGIPDIICCVSGRFLAIECKAGRNKPTALQTMQIERIRHAGGAAAVVNELNIDSVSEWIRRVRSGL
jgi:Holliday junction resolvase